MALAEILKIFCPEGNNGWNDFCCGFQDNCIRPAMDLHEKFLTATHHFFLDLNPYMVWTPKHTVEPSAEFFEKLDEMEMENLLQNRKKLQLAKLDPQPTLEDLYENLTNVVTVAPGLWMRQVGRADVVKDRKLLTKQSVLVAFGSPEKREAASKAKPGLMSQILFQKNEKNEKSERFMDAFTSSWKLGG
jgi:hypothetical protein